MYVNFKKGMFERTIEEGKSINEEQNLFYLFPKNLYFGNRYEDFMVIVNNLGALIKDMRLNPIYKERILNIIYLLNDVTNLISDYDLKGEKLVEDMLNKMKNFHGSVDRYELKMTLDKVNGFMISPELHKEYIDYDNLSFTQMLDSENPMDMSRINYIVDNDTVLGYTDINSKSNFWAISMLDAETTNYDLELFSNLKEMLFNIGDLPRNDKFIYNSEGEIIYTEMTTFNLHREIVHAVNYLLRALRYSLNSHSFKTNNVLYCDLDKIENGLDAFYRIMQNAYQIANYQYRY